MLTKSDYSLIYSYLRLAQLRAQRIAERSRNADTRREQLRRCRELTHLLEKISGTPIDPPQDLDELPTRPRMPTITTATGDEKPPRKRGRKPQKHKGDDSIAPPQ